MRILWEVIDMKKNMIIMMLWIFAVHFMKAQDSTQVTSKEHVKTNHLILGISLPEGPLIGVRHQINDLQIGMSLGFYPRGNDQQFQSFNAELIINTAGTRNSLGNQPWYMRAGISYMQSENEYEWNSDVVSHLRYGYEFAISKSLAFQIDAGLMFHLSHQEIQKKPRNTWFELDFDFPILPSIGLTTAFNI